MLRSWHTSFPSSSRSSPRVEEAEAYDAGFTSRVQASPDDPRPSIPHDHVMADMEAIIRAAGQRRTAH
ncbi:type II toxin-antitoxin system RelB family antitoxin [Paraburkholderia sp. MM5482-R1]|uniref:type II toxin-antitoxin system RelB family antitoxin n=1 Tax=unclassified Paraburkholderia TaxID=2615204 RepID=UPI003D1D73B3